MNDKPSENLNTSASVDEAEIARFSAIAESWWDPNGKFKPLHSLGPVRINYIKNTLLHHFDIASEQELPLSGLRVLDIGCGGGLLSEPMAKLGADVVGADATEKNIQVAKVHANENDIKINYIHTTAEQLAEAGEKFDIIINMEVIEHVSDINSFLSACRSLLNENGIMLISTLNRTPKSFLFAIVGAEYILGWLPKGTHTWDKFIKPSELAKHLGASEFTIKNLKGMSYQALNDTWKSSDDLSVNYMGYALPIKRK
jgi:2-polyprenyl-6-hydroxyphenyl methylase/3-demethylubiquinone-9 3-methyltransferase